MNQYKILIDFGLFNYVQNGDAFARDWLFFVTTRLDLKFFWMQLFTSL